MKIQRTLAPTAAPIAPGDLLGGVLALLRGRVSLERVREEMRAHFGVREVLFTSSGTAALALTLSALRAGSPRRSVVIPAYTCFSVPSAVSKLGLEIVPCDVDPATLDFDFRALERVVGPDTLCVVATHLLGQVSRLDRVIRLCRTRGAAVVEDVAQALGGTYRGRPLGTLGDVGFFSFGRGKQVTCGAGGMVVTDDPALGRRLAEQHAALPCEHPARVLRDLAMVLAMGLLVHPRLYWLPAGLPFLRLGETRFRPEFPVQRMHAWRAALLRGWADRLARANRARRLTAARILRRLPPSARAVQPTPGADSTLLRLPVLMADGAGKASACLGSRHAGLGLSPLYPAPVHRIPELAERLAGTLAPGAEAVAERLVTIPIHALVTPDDQQRICRLLGDVEAHRSAPQAGLVHPAVIRGSR